MSLSDIPPNLDHTNAMRVVRGSDTKSAASDGTLLIASEAPAATNPETKAFAKNIQSICNPPTVAQ